MLRDDSKSHLSTFSFSPPVSPAKSNTSAISESHVFLSSASSPSSFNSSFISATSPISTSQLSKSSVASITSTVAKEKEVSSSTTCHSETPFSYFSATANNNSSFSKTTTTTNCATTDILTHQKRLIMTEVGQIPPPAKYAQSEVTPGIPVHIINRSYSPDKPLPSQHPPSAAQQQYTIPAHSHYNHPPATLSSPHFHTTSVPLPPGVRPPPSSHVHHAPSPLTEQLRQVLADRERHGGHGTPSSQSPQEHSQPQPQQLLPPPPRRVIPEHWQGRKSDTESSGNTSISSNMSSPRIDTKPSPMPEKWMNLSPVEWSNEQVSRTELKFQFLA